MNVQRPSSRLRKGGNMVLSVPRYSLHSSSAHTDCRLNLRENFQQYFYIAILKHRRGIPLLTGHHSPLRCDQGLEYFLCREKQ